MSRGDRAKFSLREMRCDLRAVVKGDSMRGAQGAEVSRAKRVHCGAGDARTIAAIRFGAARMIARISRRLNWRGLHATSTAL